MKIIIVIMLSLLMLPIVFASLSYNNNNLPYVPKPTITSLLSSSGNVSSVTSSDNCIIVNPTTGNVILTFNSSCAGSGGTFNNTNVAYLNNTQTFTKINTFNENIVAKKNITSYEQLLSQNQPVTITGSTALNTAYNNTDGYTNLYIASVSLSNGATAGSRSAVQLKINGVIIKSAGTLNALAGFSWSQDLVFVVPNGSSYEIKDASTGTGSATLGNVRKTPI